MTCLLTTSVARAELKLDNALDSEPAANLLPNSSFEEKTDDGVGGWSSRTWHGEQNCRWSVESPGRTGGQCVSIQLRPYPKKSRIQVLPQAKVYKEGYTSIERDMSC